MTYSTYPTGKVRTVTGDVSPDSLGTVSAHEHLWVGPSLMTSLEPEFLLNDLERTVTGVKQFIHSGGKALVDALPLIEGRSARALREISNRTRVPLIAMTGFHRLKYYSGGHWIHSQSANELAEILICELQNGMDERCSLGPKPVPTDIRAGALKIATEFHHVPNRTEVLIEAVILAHHATGSPIMIHIEQGTAAHAALDLFESHDVPLEAIMLSHADRNPDRVLHKELASRNCYLGYDWMGRIKVRPDSVVYELISELTTAGYANRITLGLDLVRRTYWPSYGGGPGLQYLFGEFVPRLRSFGISDGDIQLISATNPQKWLTFRAPLNLPREK